MISTEPPPKRPGKNAKSCAECRRRKVRCDWPSQTASRCTYCKERGLNCEPQRSRPPEPDAVRVTTRARLANLERNQTSLWAAVRSLQSQNGIVAPAGRRPPDGSSRRESVVSHSNAFGGDDDENDEDEDSDGSDSLSPPNAPIHLVQLFDNGVLDTAGGQLGPSYAASPRHASSPKKAQECAALQTLMPSRADMTTITEYASSWLPLYASLLPMVNAHKSPEAMLAHYDEVQQEASVVGLSNLILHIALAVQHAPSTANFSTSPSMQHIPTFVENVSELVEQVVIGDDTTAGTLEGIEVALLFLRLQLGRVKITKMWLLSRRVIALAELLGLPRAAAALSSIQDSMDSSDSSEEIYRLQRRSQAWASICAIDRFSSMLWSLPLATANYPLPKSPIIDSKGHVNTLSYLYGLADIARQVLELDGMISARKPLSELFNAVMCVDHELRSLATSAGNDWWNMQPTAHFTMDAMMQYCHQYYTIRIHLRLALAYDGQSEQFAFNLITCLNACQELARRYLTLRPAAAAGFFAGWVLDMQAFTSAVFLQLASYRMIHKSDPGRLPQGFDIDSIRHLIDQMVSTMASAAGNSVKSFAHQAAAAIRSLDSLLQRPQAQESLTMKLNLPLIGNIQISRKSNTKADFPAEQRDAPETMIDTGSQSVGQDASLFDSNAALTSQLPPYTSEAMDMMDSLSYSMEIPESYPFLAYDGFLGEI